ncbi:hypothetical protein [Gulosibacter sp. 10]|uniref:hypothetical protein n=1 Tax=Gulosibacter sp. 10 TaxID=1255570 RepID=UPI00097EC4C5|nr:hypothetical protein [Gulosibacter sp. 10]SJM68668.1 hypothetical protein FM112_13525 [Gulosibacter sp. 10]
MRFTKILALGVVLEALGIAATAIGVITDGFGPLAVIGIVCFLVGTALTVCSVVMSSLASRTDGASGAASARGVVHDAQR